MALGLLLVFEAVGVHVAAAAQRSAGDAQPDGVGGVAHGASELLGHVLEAGEGGRGGSNPGPLQMLAFHTVCVSAFSERERQNI